MQENSITVQFFTEDKGNRQLASEYWSGEYVSNNWIWHYSCKDIAERFGIKPTSITSVVRTIAVARDKSILCIGCGSERQLGSRSDFRSRLPTIYKCQNCKIREKEKATNEQEKANRCLQIERLAVSTKLEELITPFNYKTIDFSDAITLYSIFVASDNACEQGEFKEFDLHLCSSDELKTKLLLDLYKKNILFFSPKSPVQINKEGPWVYDRRTVWWRIAPAENGWPYTQVMSFIGNLTNLFANDPEYASPDSGIDIGKIWWQLAVDEAKIYLKEQVREFRLPDYQFGPKTDHAITHALTSYSIPQVRRCILNVVKNAAALSVSRSYNRHHANNTIPGNLISFVDRASSNGWAPFPLFRKWPNEEPILLTVLFDSILKTGINGFKTVSGNSFPLTVV